MGNLAYQNQFHYQYQFLFYALAIALFLLIYMLWHFSFKETSSKLFFSILLWTVLTSIIDILAWFYDGRSPEIARYGNLISNTLLTACEYMPGYFWLKYMDLKLTEDTSGLKVRSWLYLIPGIFIWIMVAINIHSGMLFSVSADNEYLRGPQIHLVFFAHYAVYAFTVALLVVNRRNANVDILMTIAVFLIVPIVASVLQLMNYGLALIWPAFTFVNLVAFILLEKDTLLKDPLTGLKTRGIFEQKVVSLLNNRQSFSLLMIDMDDFKKINDSFGHQSGDQALIDLTDIVNEVKRKTDMFCRYAGDEFMVLSLGKYPDAASQLGLRIHQAISDFNRSANRPYVLSLSIGTLHVPKNAALSFHDVFERLDRSMYAEKNGK